MISSQARLIFLHAPKTAGNSIQHLLLPFSDDEMVVAGHQDGRDRFGVRGRHTRSKHAKLADYRETLGADLDTYRVAMTVRHPVERAISMYFSEFRLWGRDSAGRIATRTPRWDRDSFLEMLASTASLADFITIDGTVHNVDFLLRHETLRSDFDAMADALRLPVGGADLPYVNRCKAEPGVVSSVIADPWVQDRVATHFAADLRLFGYDRVPPGSAPSAQHASAPAYQA